MCIVFVMRVLILILFSSQYHGAIKENTMMPFDKDILHRSLYVLCTCLFFSLTVKAYIQYNP